MVKIIKLNKITNQEAGFSKIRLIFNPPNNKIVSIIIFVIANILKFIFFKFLYTKKQNKK
jgi:hypothetical protein